MRYMASLADRMPSISRLTVALALAALVAAGAALRVVGLDWDSGHHLHPDERFLTMVGSALEKPQDFLGYLDTDTSTLNPRNRGHAFLSYGTWSITLTYLIAERYGLTSYGEIYKVGRALSAGLDTLTILLVFGIGARLYDRRVGLLAAALTTFTTFHIQQAHFYSVDAPLTAFVALTLFGLSGYIKARGSRAWLELLVAGVGMGMAFGTKVSVWLLAPLAIIVIAVTQLRRVRNGDAVRPASTRPTIANIVLHVVLLGVVALATLKVAQPDMFAGPGWPNVVNNPVRYQEVTAGQWTAPGWWTTLRTFMPDSLEMYLLPDPRWADSMHRIQSQVTGFGMDWPPNHQWWGREGYLFPWRNIVLYGMGLPLGIAMTIAWFAAGFALWRGDRRHLLLWLWATAFFAFQGIQWSKTMRYYLPIYPAMTLLTAWSLVAWWDRSKSRRLTTEGDFAAANESTGKRSLRGQLSAARDRLLNADLAPKLAAAAMIIVVGGTALYGLAFSRIYMRDHSQVAASKWLYHNIPTAFGVHVAQDGTGEIAGEWLPAQPAGTMRFSGFNWLVDGDDWLGPMRVLLPYGPDPTDVAPDVALDEAADAGSEVPPDDVPDDLAEPDRASGPLIEVDGVRLAHLSDPLGEGRSVPIEVVLTGSAWLGEDGRPQNELARVRGVAHLLDDASHLRLDFEAPLSLRPRQEVHLWLKVDNPPLAGRTSVFAYETSWDLPVPHGRLGYGAYDDPGTDWAEGLFGVVNFEMYGEEHPTWLEDTLSGIGRIDYWISPTNRVYDAIRQLPMRFPQAIAFYDDVLFGEQLGWRMAADINSYPGIGPLEINDQPAEEAFHVYDHPRVVVWEKTDEYDEDALRARLEPLAADRRWRFPPVSDRALGRFLDALLGRTPVDRAFALAYSPGPVCGLLADLSGRPVGFRVDDGRPGGPVSGAEDHWCRAIDARLGAVAAASEPGTVEGDRPPLEASLLDPERRSAMNETGTWRHIFNPDSIVNSSSVLAALVWYLVLLALALIAFPWISQALPGFPDRGWALARTAGLLVTAYLGWLVASFGWLPHNPWLVLAIAALLGAASAWRMTGTAGRELAGWARRNARSLLTSEAVFLVLFLFFVALRASNPDLWHPWKGGEKPMDLAYFNAVLRSEQFPPYDPWFAGGKLNYYYFGFVFVGALTELTRIVPWVAYNLAIPTMAALTGASAFSIVWAWTASSQRSRDEADDMDQGPERELSRTALGAGVLASVLAVMSGNLYQPLFMMEQLCVISPREFASNLPGLERLVCAAHGLRAMLVDGVSLQARAEWWYWNASRAIPAVDGDVQPITEFPFFTFLYGDLHAHMMAMPLAMLAVAVAFAWATDHGPASFKMKLIELPSVVRLGLAVLAVGALWPTNTWDYPSYGLALAGGLAISAFAATRRLNVLWLARVAIPGLVLLCLSLVAFLPYHNAYLTPYTEFSMWIGHKTPLSAYIIAHGLFLFPLVTWSFWRIWIALRAPQYRSATAWLVASITSTLLIVAAVLLSWSRGAIPSHLPTPTPYTPFVIATVIAIAATVTLRPGEQRAERFAGWLFLIGALLTGFVEYVVLSGDIGRMNTVFKFYIQVWLLWSLASAFAVGQLWRPLSRMEAGRWWRITYSLLLVSGLVYTVTAARIKAADRFPASGGAIAPPGMEWRDQWATTLDGEDFMTYAVYDDAGFPLALVHDLEAMRWLRRNVDGTPTILEAFRVEGYRWGARYSIHTGLPTVVGWDWHQKQQRNAVGGWHVEDRTRDVAEMYDTTDEERAKELLLRYDVRYVIVGEMERAFQSAVGLEKFERWANTGSAEKVYQNEGVIIYRLNVTAGEQDAREGDG